MEESPPKITENENTTIEPLEVLEEPEILEEIVIEELSIDGVCGVY
jgi:mycofactocin precursor